MAERPSSLVDQLVGWCFALLLGAMALYGAVQILRCIWPWLAVGLAITGAVAICGWLVVRWWRYR